MHKLQIPAVTRPDCDCPSAQHREPEFKHPYPRQHWPDHRMADSGTNWPTTRSTTVKALLDTIPTHFHHPDQARTLRIANARPSIDLDNHQLTDQASDSTREDADAHTAARTAASAQPCDPSGPIGHHHHCNLSTRTWWRGFLQGQVVDEKISGTDPGKQADKKGSPRSSTT